MKIAQSMASPSQRPTWRLVLPLIVAFLVPGEVINGIATPLGQSWWDALAKPAFAPPGWWVFPVVWIVNYTVMWIAVAFIWPHRQERLARIALTLFLIQLVLGFAWIPLVYGFHSILLGLLLDISGLLLVLGTTWMFRHITSQAAWWMLPYVAWLIYTMVLKFAMWRLN
jgi:benzodiazapine receptor